jgi:DNA-binding transcriptional regulator LsrR (DeoR family)
VEQLMDLATRFYVAGETQVEIARSLGLDPSTVSRYLSRARADGIVRIEIRQPRTLSQDLASELAERFRLDRAVVAAGEGGVARVAADFVSTQLLNGMRIGLSWGRMLSSVIHALPPEIVHDLDIALLHGGVGSAGDGVQGHELARQVASRYPGSQVTYLHAPVLVDSPDIKRAMLRDSSIKAATEAAAARELALVGIGALDESAPLVRYGHLSKADRERLLSAGAVGDTCTRFFTAEGEPVRVLDRMGASAGDPTRDRHGGGDGQGRRHQRRAAVRRGQRADHRRGDCGASPGRVLARSLVSPGRRTGARRFLP